jgi:hypothetical protein
MALYFRKSVILAKIESTYGTDPTPTGAANSMLVSELDIRPMVQTLVDRALIRSFFGNSEQLPAQLYAELTFDVELQSSGTAGTAASHGVLLQACGFVETDGVSDVQYDPTSTAGSFKSVTIYAYVDSVLHKLVGARGDVSFIMQNQQIPKMRFRFIGQYSTPTDASPSGVDYTTFKTPAIVNATNTSTFTLHSVSPVTASIEINMANNIVYRDYVGGTKQVLITDRKPAGTITMEAVSVATKNWWTTISAATTGALAITHGLSAGYISKIDAPAVQIVNPTFSDSDGITMMQAGLVLVPTGSGNNEIKLTFQ